MGSLFLMLWILWTLDCGRFGFETNEFPALREKDLQDRHNVTTAQRAKKHIASPRFVLYSLKWSSCRLVVRVLWNWMSQCSETPTLVHAENSLLAECELRGWGWWILRFLSVLGVCDSVQSASASEFPVSILRREEDVQEAEVKVF